ncbi:hypothetical protein Leryth_010926 [Lithospermum erythrorhizon]|nr:hypothetical protein Leryth_010926 [Lithospermum erythrorhizon]
MHEKLGIEELKFLVCNVLYKLWDHHGGVSGAIGYDFDYDDYHSFVHGRLPYDNLKPDPIFTNADKVHASVALNRLGLEGCFEGIICFETLNPIHKSTVSDDEDDIAFVGRKSPPCPPHNISSNAKIFDIIGHLSQVNNNINVIGLPKTPIVCKPSEAAIEKALKIANISPQRTLFFEDSVRNIQAGKRVGLHTVLVGTSQRVKGADYALESIHNIREALPELWEAGKVPEANYTGTPVETFVIA